MYDVERMWDSDPVAASWFTRVSSSVSPVAQSTTESRVQVGANERVESPPCRGRGVDRALDEGGDLGVRIQLRQFVRSVAFPGRLDDPAGEAVEAGIIGAEVMGVVVVEEELPQRRVGEDLGLVAEQCDRTVWVGGEHKDPQVALQVDPSRREAPAGQLLHMGTDLRGQRRQMPGGELTQTALRCPHPTDAVGELVADLAERLLELLVGR